MSICPKFVYLRAAGNNGDSDTFLLIDDSKIANISAIRANTPFPVSLCVLACQNIKTKELNYCDRRDICESGADKKACESNKTKYVSLYVDKSEKKEKSPVYLLAFVRDNELKRLATEGIIAEELKRTVDWLDSFHNTIRCYIFCYTATPRATTRVDAVAQKYLKKSGFPFCSIQSVPIKSPRVLYVNGGSLYFKFVVQEAGTSLQSKP
jgi:hypothetical protein